MKHPHWSVACCQSLLLPVNDLQEDTGFIDDEQELDEPQHEKMEMFALSIDELNNHPEANDNEAFALHPASIDDEAFAIRRAPKEDDEALRIRRASRKDEAFAIHPEDIDIEADMPRAGHRASRVNKGYSVDSGEGNKAFIDHPTKKDHLVIDVIPEENEGEGKEGGDALEARDNLGQDEELDGQVEEDEEEEEEPPVEMCDQEVQTDLSTLDMDEAEIYELFGEPQDESL